MTYIGRFAPSPTGPLHFGSLLAALASFLDARANDGQWLLRIEDLDPPREDSTAKQQFPDVLEAFGLYWDGELSFQSERLELYADLTQQLLQQDAAYRCNCSRKTIQTRSQSSYYDGHCRQHPPAKTAQSAVRVICPTTVTIFTDLIQGPQQQAIYEQGDFVIHRRDGLFAYLLAVVADDYAQGITHVVRGSDLLCETGRQLHLQQLLGYPHPHYAHIPVATNTEGQKLSKQTFARALDLSQPGVQLFSALEFLDQKPPAQLRNASVTEILEWAIAHWQMDNIEQQSGKVFAGGV